MRAIALAIALGLLALGAAAAQDPHPQPSASPEGPTLSLGHGQQRSVPGTDLRVTLESVTDMGSRGCLGGPIGCPKRAQLTVARGDETQSISVSWRRAGPGRGRGVVAFGYRFFLASVERDAVTLRIEAAEDARPER